MEGNISVTTAAADPVTPPRRNATNNLFLLSPLQCIGDIRDICLTSPFNPRHRTLERTPPPDRIHYRRSPTRDFFSTDIMVATPPPPSPSVMLQDSSIQTAVGCSSQRSSPFRCGYAIKRLLSRCGCEPSVQRSVERLGWVGEQVLCGPLQMMARTLSRVEFRCQEVEWQRLECLRDAFVHSAVAHLEAGLSVHDHHTSITLPSSVTALLTSFNQVAHEIFSNSVTPASRRRQTDHGLKRCELLDPAPSRPLQLSAFPSSTCSVPEISWPNAQMSSGVVAPSTKPTVLCPSHIPDDGIVKSPLSRRLLNLVRKQSVEQLRRALSQPVPEEYRQNDFPRSAHFSSPVVRRAQKRLGELWRLMDDVGIGNAFVTAALQGRRGIRRSKPTILSQTQPTKLAFNGPLLKCEAANVGALSLMGARYVRRGRYISRKAIQMKSKRTREKNQKRQQALRESHENVIRANIGAQPDPNEIMECNELRE